MANTPRIALPCNCSVLIVARLTALKTFERRERIGPLGLAALVSSVQHGFVALAFCSAHPAVAECAVIGVADEIKGQVPRGFVVLKAGAAAERLADELIAAVRENIGAVAYFKLVDIVPALPKTRSGKILRKTMRGIADGRDEPLPSTIEDPAVLDALRPILRN